MGLRAFDHVNVLTENLDVMVEWYDRVLGLKAGPRPDFAAPGAWLYLNGQAIVHLVGVGAAPQSVEPRIEHFALSAEGLDNFRAHLATHGVAVRDAEVPGFGVLQLNIIDPDGNHIHIDFAVDG